ncbi:MAG TPA: AI-2E family transporter [Caulobacteraceae bacterium]|nr:AI-2E family transporter [Caulobacteraceae bacterium]
MTTPPLPASHAARNALVLIAVVVAGAALHWLAAILTPLALALFLMVMTDGMARSLRARAPALGGAALGVGIALSVIGFALIVFFVAENGATFVGRLMADQAKLDMLLTNLARASHVALPHTVNQLLARIDLGQFVPAVAGGVQSLLSNGLFVLVYLGFMLAARGGFERKAVRLFREREDRRDALQVFLRVRDSLEQYLWIQTICGAIIALGGWAIMLAVGLESAFFWAFLIFVLNYIPIVGAAIAIIAPVLFALVEFRSYGPGLSLLGGLLALTFIVGNILLPRMQGKRLNLDPVMVLFSLGFWGAIWGVTGMFLSTPLTMLAMVILAQFEGSRWIAVLLSADGDPHSLGEASARAPASG